MLSNVMAFGTVSGMLFAKQSLIPKTKDLLESSKSGVYIGNSEEGHMPIFLEFSMLVNPHVFVCGMTGSGKTYLMKNLMLKLRSAMQAEIYCIDFTGEYFEFANASGIVYVRVSNNGTDMPDVAAKVLGDIVQRMRKQGTRRTPCAFVFLDESWKLLSNSASFTTLLREGRKYGVGLIMASQLIEDIAAPMLDNIATIFAFRLQNRQSIELLERNYGIGEGQLSAIQNLGVGQAMLFQMYRSGGTKAFVVNVHGVSLKHYIKLEFGDNTYIEISAERLEEILGSVCGECAEVAIAGIANGNVSLISLISSLSNAGVSSIKIIEVLRRIGMKDDDIADAFAALIAR
ncbi:MAG: type IV secretory system conjugative DNA transfer family protein [Candidatus Micrarchaeaceae archaeon]